MEPRRLKKKKVNLPQSLYYLCVTLPLSEYILHIFMQVFQYVKTSNIYFKIANSVGLFLIETKSYCIFLLYLLKSAI